MKTLPKSQAAARWARHPDLLADHGSTPGPRLASRRVDANFESRQAIAYGAAAAISQWLFDAEEGGQGTGPVLAEIYEHGIWASSENLQLYYAWRRSHGDAGTIEDSPGHLFEPRELDDLTSLLQMSLLNGWGLSCGAPAAERAFHVDHDGHGLLIGKTAEDIAAMDRLD